MRELSARKSMIVIKLKSSFVITILGMRNFDGHTTDKFTPSSTCMPGKMAPVPSSSSFNQNVSMVPFPCMTERKSFSLLKEYGVRNAVMKH